MKKDVLCFRERFPGFARFAGQAGCALILLSLLVLSACRTPDPAAEFIARMDLAPPDERPRDWERTKELMARPVPAAGQPAPDFTLPTIDGEQMITRSAYQAGRPLVLIFGSFT
jgi:hypothetical protein